MSDQDPFAQKHSDSSNQGGGFQYQGGGGGHEQLPNSTGVLVLGILSIVTCILYGIVGIILGIITLVMAKNADALYRQDPSRYTQGSYNNMKAGRICGIIGLILSALFLIYVIVVLVFMASVISSSPYGSFYNF